jgi:hypothetical protein
MNLLAVNGATSDDTYLISTGGNNAEFILEFSAIFYPGDNATMIVYIETTTGLRKFYINTKTNPDNWYGDSPLLNLGDEVKDGVLRTYQINFQAWFDRHSPGEEVLEVQKIYLKTRLCQIGNLSLMSLGNIVYDGDENEEEFPWIIYKSPLAEINILEEEDGNKLVELDGNGETGSFYMWAHNNSQYTWEWDQAFNEDYNVIYYITVEVSEGVIESRLIWYHGKDFSMIYKTNPLISLGSETKNGFLQTIKRNLQEDWTAFYPGQIVLSVSKIFIKTKYGIIDNIISSNEAVTNEPIIVQ